MKYTLRVSRHTAPPEILRLEAASADEATAIAERDGLTVLSIRKNGLNLSKKRFPLLLFCQELTVLLESGLLLTEALQTLSKKERHLETQAVIDRLIATVKSGHSFSEALSNDPEHFPSLFVAMVRACETTGNLSEGLSRFAHYLEHIDVLRKKMVSASIYPALILGFGLLVMLFLLAYVVPRFSEIYASRDTELSMASSILLQVGTVMKTHGLLLAVLALVLVLLSGFALSQASVRARLGHAVTRLPKIGERIFIYHLSRFYRTFAMLLRSGIPVVPALAMVSELLGQTLQGNVSQARRMIIDGYTFTQSMHDSELVTPVATQLFQVGERSGNLDTMMERAAQFHEEEMMRWVDAFSKTVEPVLMALLGVVIGAIVFLMYLPIFELASGL